jgi:hypothetical protein
MDIQLKVASVVSKMEVQPGELSNEEASRSYRLNTNE